MNNYAKLNGSSELEWFHNVKNIPPHILPYCGVETVRSKCVELLHKSISTSLPNIKKKLSRDLDTSRKKLMELGGASGKQPAEIYLVCAKKFVSKGYKKPIKTTICQKKEASLFCQSIKKCWEKLRKQIEQVKLPTSFDLNKYRDARSGLSELSIIDCLAKKYLKQLKGPLLSIADEVNELAENLILSIEITQYPDLANYFQQRALSILSECHSNTRNHLSTMVSQECSYINLSHLERAKESGFWSLFTSAPKEAVGEQGVLKKVETYCTVIATQIQDQSIKTIWYHLLKTSYKKLESLYTLTPPTKEISALLNEPEAIASQKLLHQTKIQKLEAALGCLECVAAQGGKYLERNGNNSRASASPFVIDIS